MQPMSPALAGRLSTTEPPGKHEMFALAIIIQLNLRVSNKHNNKTNKIFEILLQKKLKISYFSH